MNQKIQQSKDFPSENSLKIALTKELELSASKWEDFSVPFGHELLIEALIDYLKGIKVKFTSIYVCICHIKSSYFKKITVFVSHVTMPPYFKTKIIV